METIKYKKVIELLLATSIVLALTILILTIKEKNGSKELVLSYSDCKCSEQPAPIEDKHEYDYELNALPPMTVTIYHAVPSQTDSTPMITASGFDITGLDVEEIRICALSRDLLKRWGGKIDYGDTIYIDLPDPELSGYWTVEDTMAKRWTNHIDLLVPTTRKGGKWQGISAYSYEIK